MSMEPFEQVLADMREAARPNDYLGKRLREMADRFEAAHVAEMHALANGDIGVAEKLKRWPSALSREKLLRQVMGRHGVMVSLGDAASILREFERDDLMKKGEEGEEPDG